MAGNTKRQSKQGAAEAFRRGQRAYEKGDFKQAVKEAKVCYRQEPVEEHRRLLERAWLARARSLAQRGLRDEGKAVAEELLQLGITDPTVQKDLPALLLTVGLFDRVAGSQGVAQRAAEGTVPAPEPDLRWMAVAADQSVMRPADAPGSLPGIREGAVTVRRALDLLYQGQEDAAVAVLQAIPRHSPYADWKFFVRGLAAYYRQDDEPMRANWARLEPGRLAHRIAEALRRLAEPQAGPVSRDDSVNWVESLLERRLWGQSLSDQCAQVQRHLAQDEWRVLFRGLRGCQTVLSPVAPELWERVRHVVYASIVHKSDPDLVDGLAKAMEPLPEDPHWHRARALVWERLQDGLDEAQESWSLYLDDLAQSPVLSADERRLAQALVLERLGQQAIDMSDAVGRQESGLGDDDRYDDDDYEEDDDDGDYDDDEDLRDAVEYLERALQLAPDLRSAYSSLARAHESGDHPELAAETWRRLLKQFPDDLDALRGLYFHHFHRDEMLQARDWALEAYRLRPTNPEMRKLAYSGHLGAARILAMEARWDEARQALDAAQPLTLPEVKRDQIPIRRAVIEFKAGNIAEGRKWMETALAPGGDDPAGVLLSLHIEAMRLRLANEVSGIAVEPERRWQAELKQKCRSSAAGAMCERLGAILIAQVDYPGRSYDLRRVLEYVRRCSRVRWTADDLRHVSVFLDSTADIPERLADHDGLLRKLVERGRKNFRQEACFHALRGKIEMARGPRRCNRILAEECFKQASRWAKQSPRRSDQVFAQMADEALAVLDHTHQTMPFSSGFLDDEDPFDGPPPDLSAGGVLHMIAEMCKSMGVAPKEILAELEDELPPGMVEDVFQDTGKTGKAAASSHKRRRR